MNADNWKAVLLLSIVIPISLLATFKLTGFLQNPATIAEIITLESVEWEFERPYEYTVFDKILRVPYSSDCFSGTFDFVVIDYIENVSDLDDRVLMITSINLTGVNYDAFAENIYVGFYEDYKQSRMNWLHSDFNPVNLSIIKFAEGLNEKNDLKIFINLASVNHSNNVYFYAPVYWSLGSQNTQNHELKVIYEILHFNGTTYNKIIQPFKLFIRGD